MNLGWRCLLAGLIILAQAQIVQAQSRDPSERLLEEQIERQRLEAQQRSRPGQKITTEKVQGPVKEAVCFPIETIALKGITIFKPETFDPLLAEFSNQCLGQESIGILIQRLSAIYAEKGYITTRAYVPAQDISTKKLTIVRPLRDCAIW